MRNSYRIVRDRYSGYEAQVRYWWFPFVWLQCFGVNTRGTVEASEDVCRKHAAGVVKHIGKLP